MAGQSLRFEGVPEVEKALRKLNEELQGPILRQALVAAGEPIAHEASRIVVKRTGKLSRNIVVKLDGKKALSAKVMPNRTKKGAPDDAFYGAFVELGTSKMAAQPFLRPAHDAKKVEALERAAETIRDGVEQVLK